jgi:hypothetical protein
MQSNLSNLFRNVHEDDIRLSSWHFSIFSAR